MVKEIFLKDAQKYNSSLAEELKKIPEFNPPEWSYFVKTSCSKQRPPEEVDFWYKRAASVLRKIYLKGVIGVQKLRKFYGSKKKKGVKPPKFKKASGKIIRTILQQAEKAGFVEKVDKFQHGRRLTKKGRDFLDSIKVEETNG